MAFHFLVRWPDLIKYDYHFPDFLDAGKSGVELFFVISGLVISMTILKTRSATDFAVKRFARLFPALFVCCTLTFLFENNIGPDLFHTSLPDYFMSLTLLADKLGFKFVDGVYWTLVVEIEFYILMGM